MVQTNVFYVVREKYLLECMLVIILFLLVGVFALKVKLSPFSRGRPEGSLFNSYYTEVQGGRYSFPWIAPLYP